MSESRVIQVNIEDHMKSAYIDYSMSVIVSRALPDVRDGLKPVHRRVLFGMNEMGMSYNKAHKKAARIVGDVLGKYHPHGDTSVYDALVRMAQDWSLRYPLIDGQGNFGSIEGDSAAAMRYTEARMRRLADEMLSDIDKDTVDFHLNYDDTLEEPTVLPAKFPNLLVNGAEGIAVGMATRMMPHNMREVIGGTIAMIDNPEITLEELMQYIKAPDFPTGGIIYGTSGIREAYETGRGRVVVRGKADIQNHNGRERIIIREVPYQINPAILVQKIEELAVEKKIEGISEVRNESNKEGIRLVIEVKRDGAANVILNQLYKMTPLQNSYGINNVVLVNGRPMVLNLTRLLEEFIKFRLEVIVRRTQFELKKAQDRAHILEGLYIALDDLDRIIVLIRAAKTPDEAQQALMGTTFNLSDAVAEMVGVFLLNDKNTEGGEEQDIADRTLSKIYNLSEVQAKAILEMRLQRLTGLERDKIKHEYDELRKHILHLKAILADEGMRRDIIKTELTDINARYGDDRKTEIELQDGDISIADMIEVEEVVVTISHLGYIKRIAVSEFKAQNRGGRGSRGTKTRVEDFVEHMFIANTHDYLLFFTEKGKCHWLRTYEISEGTKTSAGRVIQNILSIPADDKIRAYVKIRDLTDMEFAQSNFIIFATKQGLVKKTSVEHFTRIRKGGINAITIREDDELLEAKLTNGNCQIMLANRNGRTIRFPESRVRPMLRTSAGVAGLELDEDGTDCVMNMISVEADDDLTSVLVLSENGIGKRSSVEAYRLVNNRGGKGVSTMALNDKTGKIVALKAVRDTDDLIITTKAGITIRMAVADIRVQGRATQGVRLIRLDDGEEIADVAVVRNIPVEDADSVELDENGVPIVAVVENTEGAADDVVADETTDEVAADVAE